MVSNAHNIGAGESLISQEGDRRSLKCMGSNLEGDSSLLSSSDSVSLALDWEKRVRFDTGSVRSEVNARVSLICFPPCRVNRDDWFS